MIATSQFTISVIKDGKDGAPGATGPQGVSVEKVVREYRLSDSSTEMTGSGDGYTWSETKPKIPSGKYLWERERTDLSNNTSEHGTAHCDIVTSGLVLDVDRNTNAITSKVWESDITTKINEYDGSTGKSIRDRVTKTETDISGINTTISDIQTDVAGKADGSTVTTLTTKVNTISDTVDGHTQTIESNTSRIDDAEDEIESTKTVANQTADKFTWLVKDGTSASNFTLTSRVAELISPQVVIKDPAGSATIISGGKIHANAITTAMLATDAIKSSNYQASTSASSPYSATGTFLDLGTGTLYMPNFGVNGTTGEAYFNGTVNANAGKFGDDSSYWNIETVYDYNMQPHAALVGTGSPYLQTGNWQVSDNAVATRKYTSTSDSSGNATYYKDSGTNTFYDVGMKIPSNFSAYSASDSSVTKYNKAFYYGRKYTGNNAPSLDSDWTYFFSIDSGGNVITAGDVYEGGVKLSDKYAAITDVGSAYLPKTGGTITGNLSVNGSFTTNLQLQTNLGSTSSAQLTGAANAVVKPGVTGTLGVGNGGTGQTTAQNAANAFINALSTGSTTSMLRDADYFISQYIGGGTSNTKYYRRPISTIWDYIEDKIETTYDITNTYRRLDDNDFDTINVTDLTAWNLIVNGAARFTNDVFADTFTGNLVGTASNAVKVGNNLVIKLNGGSTEGTNLFTYNGSAAKNVNITKAGIGLGDVENTALSTWTGSANLTTTKVGTLAAAATKGVDTSISASSTSANLPTSAAVATFVEGKGYVTSSGVTSITLKAGTGISLDTDNTAITSIGTRTISLANTYGDTKNPYGTKTKNYVLAGPTTGSDAVPIFRALVADDIPTLTPAKAGLGNVTNNKQVKGLASGTTSGHLVSWGSDGYTVSDSGIATSSVNKTVTSLASNDDGKIVLTYLDGTTSTPIEVKIIGQSGSSVSYADALNVNGTAIGGSDQPVYFTNQGKPTTANKIPKLNNTTTGGAFYAPTSTGTANQVLVSSGTGAPTWTNQSSLSVGSANNATNATNATTAGAFSSAKSVTLTGDTTGTASSTAGWSVTTTTTRLSTVGDKRSEETTPNSYANKLIFQGLKSKSTIGSPSNDTYSYLIGLRGWGDYSGGKAHELAFNDSGINHRSGSTTTWDAWEKLVTSANYTDYTVTKTGTGASGTWGISISGNASTATKWASAQTVYVALGTASKTTSIQGGSSSAVTLGVDGVLGVANGGTGAASFTANSVIMSGSTTTGAFTTRAVTNNTSASAVTANTNLITANTLAYWTGSSNLTTCSQGTFGAAATYSATTSVTSGSSALVTSGGVSSALGNYVTLSTAQTISGAKTFSAVTSITNTTASTSKSTGALKVSGGVGISGQMSANTVMIGDAVSLVYDSSISALCFQFD